MGAALDAVRQGLLTESEIDQPPPVASSPPNAWRFEADGTGRSDDRIRALPLGGAANGDLKVLGPCVVTPTTR